MVLAESALMMEFDPAPGRVFLGLEQPPLASAARWLAGAPWAWADALVVVPGARAGRILLGLLAVARGGVVTPPTILTPSALRDALIHPTEPGAGEFARRMAWRTAIGALSDSELVPLTGRPEGSAGHRETLARLLSSASDDLAGEGLRFAGLIPRLERVPGFPDLARWRLAAQIQAHYERALAEVGLVDAALHAIDAAPGRAACHVILIGLPTLRPIVRAALRGHRVTSLIAAPQDEADSFDDLGCVRVDAWLQRTIRLDPDRIVLGGGPREQAEAAMATVAGLQGCSAGDITIGLADASLAIDVERAASRVGVDSHAAMGRPFSSTSIGRLLRLVSDHLRRPTFGTLASLARHPDVERFLLRARDPGALEWWVSVLDAVAQRHLATTLEPVWRGDRAEPDPDAQHALDRLVGAVRELLDGLVTPALAAVDSWAAPLAAMLGRVYDRRLAAPGHDEDQVLLGAAEAVSSALASMAEPSPALEVSAPEALDLLLEVLDSAGIPTPTPADAVEILGWLELSLDPAPELIIVGLNEGRVPRAAESDPLLTATLRSQLELHDDRLTEARDAFILWSATRGFRRTTLIAGRQDAQGAPLLPSRLLFREPGSLASRARLTLDPPAPTVVVRPATLHGQHSAFAIAPVVDLDAPTSMSVTSFGDYLRSPYLFYLRHVLRVEPIEPAEGQLDAGARGSLIHEMLEALGRRGPWASGDAHEIEAFLRDELCGVARRRFGHAPPPAVVVQLLGLERVMRRLALWQAQRTREGWRIVEVEWRPQPRTASLMVDDAPMWLTGSIDRIERHDARGIHAILDFKTGAAPRPPAKDHVRAGRWTSLQLPLYRHLAAAMAIGPEPLLAYVSVGSQDDQVRVLEADWAPHDLSAADNEAYGVVRRVRERRFDEIGDLSLAPEVFRWLAGQGFIAGRGAAS